MRATRGTKCECEESSGVFGCAVPCKCRCHVLEERLAERDATIAAMREALETYGEHKHNCSHESISPTKAECQCGYTDALSSDADKDFDARIRADERERITSQPWVKEWEDRVHNEAVEACAQVVSSYSDRLGDGDNPLFDSMFDELRTLKRGTT